jgi:hypothetical protein
LIGLLSYTALLRTLKIVVFERNAETEAKRKKQKDYVD